MGPNPKWLCPHEKEKLGRRNRQREDTESKQPPTSPGGSPGTGPSLPTPQREVTPRLDVRLPDSRTVWHPACGTLSQQPEDTHSPALGFPERQQPHGGSVWRVRADHSLCREQSLSACSAQGPRPEHWGGDSMASLCQVLYLLPLLPQPPFEWSLPLRPLQSSQLLDSH